MKNLPDLIHSILFLLKT